MMQNKKVIGITGGISSGKTTLCTILSDMRYNIINADIITHRLYEKGNIGYIKILEYFGEEILGKSYEIDRKKLGNIVFNDKIKKEKLEEIIHPIILEEIRKEISLVDEDIVFVEIPLLFEIYEEVIKYIDFYEIWLIYISEEEQIKRLMKRNNIMEKEAINIIKNQMSLSEKIEKADFLIENNGTVKDLRKIVKNKLNMETEKI